MTYRHLIPLGLFLLLVILFGRGLFLNPREIPSALIDKPVPTFDLPTLRDPEKRFTNEIFDGKVSLYNVFASWCTACRDEHPLWMEFAREGEYPLYGFNYKDKREDALEWLAELGDPYVEIAHDFPGLSGINWGVYGVPETFVIDKQGNIRYKQIGPINREILEQKIRPLLTRLEQEPAKELTQ
ncbi:DsbE family thiol:disulfide interchange protein [Sedimenticola selenatireducens]|uniref:DsbE family thiol:disulfide interchange protein n=1 Tax=Sedimenticola selenatireducens TaxID=191960 RepID=UPI00049156E6|nr:DsbE family thiol:disulfide interchange protein [Sedimenticola selenatireducens]